MLSLLSVGLAVLLQLQPVYSLHIIDHKTCSVPYLVPLGFQRDCDRTDEFYHTEQRIESPTGEMLEFAFPPPFEAAIFHTIRPAIWTHEPWCMESVEAQNGYCVYTDQLFANGRGMSMIATPWMMAELVHALPVFQNSSGRANKAVFDDEGKSERIPMPGNAGNKMLATQRYKRGERVMTIGPTVIMMGPGNVMMLPEHQDLLINVALSRSTKEHQAIYRGQYVTPGHQWPEWDRLEKNSFSTPLTSKGYSFISAMPETATYNHACRPNLSYHFNMDTLMHETWVMHDIEPGEEMTVSYLPPYDNSTVRAEKLQAQWNFTCTCSHCSQGAEHAKYSDRRVHKIEDIIRDLMPGFDKRPPMPAKAIELVKLHTDEHIWGSIGGAEMYVAMEYMQLQQLEKAEHWATRAKESLKIWSGASHPYFEAINRMLNEVKSKRKVLRFNT